MKMNQNREKKHESIHVNSYGNRKFDVVIVEKA
jgi:hypothetical protein